MLCRVVTAVVFIGSEAVVPLGHIMSVVCWVVTAVVFIGSKAAMPLVHTMSVVCCVGLLLLLSSLGPRLPCPWGIQCRWCVVSGCYCCCLHWVRGCRALGAYNVGGVLCRVVAAVVFIGSEADMPLGHTMSVREL